MANGSMSSQSQARSPSSPTKLCSKTYKKASQLYLTRRLPEALEALQPIITPSVSKDDTNNADNTTPVAPIATAASTWRIKVWNLYITLLSAIVDLGAEEGKNQFGLKEWKSIASQVRDGVIWETVVGVGYQGREGSVDAEVVYNLWVTHAISLAQVGKLTKSLQCYTTPYPHFLTIPESTAPRDLSLLIRPAQPRPHRPPTRCIR